MGIVYFIKITGNLLKKRYYRHINSLYNQMEALLNSLNTYN